MNITELIVDYLKQGHVVELPNIGTLSNQHQSAHMDDSTHTFHAGQNAVSFNTATNGNDDIVKHIAEVECVDMKIAQLMWNNYVDALKDKLNRTSSHVFPGIGELRMSGGNYQFDGIANTTNGDNPVITDIKHYETDDRDPFAAFDAPKDSAQEAPIVIDPEPEPNHVPEPTPIPEPESVSELKPEPEPTSEPIIDVSPEPETPINENIPEEKTIEPTHDETPITKEEDDIFVGIPKNDKPSRSKGKKKLGWLWLILLLILLAAGGYYYYTNYYNHPSNPEQSSESTDVGTQTAATTETEAENSLSESEADNTNTTQKVHANGYKDQVNIFTFNTDLLEYLPDEIGGERNTILNNLNEYLIQFLSNRHYNNALPYMQTALSEYIDDRLSTLLDNEGYSIKRFFNADDYLHQFFHNELKARKASRARATVQGELMDYTLLDEMLRQVVENNDLNKSGTTPVKSKTQEAPKSHSYTANMETSSKQGFDVIAGFYTNSQTAVKMASRLKSLGCDAYIIDQNHLYYVSMGSASTRTAAEALYKQITSWYSGSVAIKQW